MHDGKLRFPVYWLTCVLMMVAASLSATTIVLPTDEQLVAKSPLIVRGSVVSSAPINRSGAIWTETVVAVEQTLKGSPGATVTIREIGGIVGDRITKVFGSPEYAAGERVLLFLTPTARGDYQTTDLYIGKFAEKSTGQRRIWVQAAEANVALLDAGLEPIIPRHFVRDAHGFETFIIERAAGRRTPVTYEIEQSSPALQTKSNFTLISEPTVYRWFTFDNGGTARWFSSGSQSGYNGGGVNEIRTAMAAWTDYPAARINYSYAGQFSGSPGGLDRPNGTNEILFDDPLQEIAGTFSGSGVVGQGGFNGVSSSANWTAPFAADNTHTQSTFRAWNITEGNLTIQDGVTPQKGMSSSRLAELVAHELGHTLGLGHSADRTALMYATMTGLGPSLRGDDEVAARWLYPSGNNAPPPPPTIQPPAAPTNLSGTSTGNSVSLQWNDNAANETGQTIYYAAGNGAFAKAADVAAGSRSATLNGFTPGTYRFYVVAFNSAGVSGTSNTISITVTSTVPSQPEPTPVSTYRSLVPVSAQTNGVGGSVWRTELTVFNSGNESTTITLTFVPGAGASPVNRTLFLAPRQSRTFANALMDLYGIASGAGAISIEATSPTTTSRLTVSSRTFTDSSLGTYGQGVPDVQGDQLQRTLYIAGMISNADYRTNIGLVNRSDASTSANLTLYDGDGNTLGTNTVTLPAKNFQQVALAAYFPATSGRSYPMLSMRINSAASDAVGVYASVVDNRTQDPIYLQAVAAPTTESVTLPAVGRAAGANNTFWRSDVTFFNPTTERLFLTVRYKSAQATLSLSSRQTRVIADILSQLGVESGSGSMEVSWSGASPVVTSRTYTTAANGGTFGQSIDPVVSFGPESYVTGLRSDVDFRSNVGFVNGGNGTINVDVTLLSAAGAPIASTSLQLSGRAQTQYSIGALFPGINVAGIGAFTLQAKSNGNMFAYGSIVDNDSGDPVFFAGR